jgi:folate-dependent tRNA-U54 methylase TrmFO/GidA
VSAPREQDYTPMNVTFGLIEDEEAPDVPQTRDRAKRREEIGQRALASVARWREEALPAAALLPR